VWESCSPSRRSPLQTGFPVVSKGLYSRRKATVLADYLPNANLNVMGAPLSTSATLFKLRSMLKVEHPQPRHVAHFIDLTLAALLPHFCSTSINTPEQLDEIIQEARTTFEVACRPVIDNGTRRAELVEEYTRMLPELHTVLILDAQAICAGDPAAKSVDEVLLSYPGPYAITVYRLANRILKLGVPLIPRIMTEIAHSRTGIDIHPGAQIGTSFVIDHGTGIVIGETTHIQNNVKLYQGVTLGALSVHKALENTKRHPTIESDVVIYANATILGGDTTVGAGSIIGGNVWLTKSIPPGSRVYHHDNPGT
jgi:serine O-acetyltransferase